MTFRWLPAFSLLLATPAFAAGSSMPGMEMSGMDMKQPPAKAHTHHYAFGQPAAAAQASRTVEIDMIDMSFAPASLAVKPGETVTFHVVNKSGVEHEFVLDTAAGQAKHRQMMAKMLAGNKTMTHHDPNAVTVAPGQSADLTWAFTKPAALEYDCNIPGHYESGMKGVLTVGS